MSANGYILERPAHVRGGVLHCIAVALFLTVIVQAEVLSDYYDELKRGARRGKKWWQK
jgi:hypothetical protein